MPMELENRDEVKLWIIRNQEGRRNLTDGWRYKLAQTKKAVLVDIGKVKYKETVGRPSKESLSTFDNDLPKHNTREVIAEELGWSKGKVAMADKVWKEAEPEVLEKVLTNEITGKVAKWRKRDG